MPDHSILIIDDDQPLVAALKDGLESLGYRVWSAYDGLQGVLQAHQGKPDVIMLDFTMPAGGGPGVYDRLRTSEDTARTPIVFLTGLSVGEVKEKIKPTPNTYFLKKPISVSQLRKVLEKILSGAAGGGRKTVVPVGDASATAVPPAAKEKAPPSPSEIRQRPAPGATPAPASEAPASPAAPEITVRAKETAPPSADASAPPPAPAPAPQPQARAMAPDASKIHQLEVRVSTADTDRLGIVYYANYFKYFESGRTELMRSIGIRHRDLERKIYLPVVEARCDYLSPSRFDDQLVVRTWIAWLGPASITFQYEIVDNAQGGRVVSRGLSRHAVVNEFWKAIRIPTDMRKRLTPHLAV